MHAPGHTLRLRLREPATRSALGSGFSTARSLRMTAPRDLRPLEDMVALDRAGGLVPLLESVQ